TVCSTQATPSLMCSPNTVTLPEAGTGNQVPQSAGASLVVVYRDPTEPLRRILFHDGIAVLENTAGASFSLTTGGIFKSASTAANPAMVTHIVGTGQPNATDRLFFNNTLVATNPFVGTSVSSDRGWASVTYKDGQNGSASLMPGPHVAEYGEVISTGVDHSNTSPYDCLSWGAVIVSTPVADVDHDGLPDGLEDNTGELT